MLAVNLDKVSVTYLIEPVFQDLSWEIQDNQCVGLVGPNGCGKSTLLKLIAGEIETETGYVVRKKGLTVGYLHQEPQLISENSVLQEALTASIDIFKIEEELKRVEIKLADPNIYQNEKKLTATLDHQEKLIASFIALGGQSYQGRIKSTLIQLGFSESDLSLSVDVLSGGQRKLLGLAKLMINQPDLLLLDEPDNHLDLEGKALLERLIQNYKGAVVIVSHDRYLLDLVVDEIMELEHGKIHRYPGNYSEYVFEKQSMLLRQQQLYEAQQKEITRLEQAAKRLMTWGKIYDNEKFSKRGQNILKRLDKIEQIERPMLEQNLMGLELPGWRGSSKVIEILNLDKVFYLEQSKESDNILFAGLDLLIWRGERVGLIGSNGTGKSVLFRIILGKETSTGGQVNIGPSVKIGYYAQQHETLDLSRTLIDTVRYAAECSEQDAVAILGRFLFTYEQGRELVGSLSGGERSRLQMALLMLAGPNFLLLDEPTNNLDIPSAEVLEDAINNFQGTVLVISHDRYFLDRVVNRIEELEGGTLTSYLGNYSDYQEKKGRINLFPER